MKPVLSMCMVHTELMIRAVLGGGHLGLQVVKRLKFCKHDISCMETLRGLIFDILMIHIE